MRFEDCKNWGPEFVRGFDTETVVAMLHPLLYKSDPDHESKVEVIYYDIDDKVLEDWSFVGSGVDMWHKFRTVIEEGSIITPFTVKSIKVKVKHDSITFYKVSQSPEPRWDVKWD